MSIWILKKEIEFKAIFPIFLLFNFSSIKWANQTNELRRSICYNLKQITHVNKFWSMMFWFRFGKKCSQNIVFLYFDQSRYKFGKQHSICVFSCRKKKRNAKIKLETNGQRMFIHHVWIQSEIQEKWNETKRKKQRATTSQDLAISIWSRSVWLLRNITLKNWHQFGRLWVIWTANKKKPTIWSKRKSTELQRNITKIRYIIKF